MALVNFMAAPVEPKQKPLIKGKKLSVKSNKSGPDRKRMLDDSSQIYGEELFKAVYKTEKAIVIGFHPFDSNMLRMSKEGKFAIQYYSKNNDSFLLYHFIEPLEPISTEDWKPDPPFLVSVTENVKVYGPFETVQEIRDKVLGIVKRQFLEDKKRIKDELIAAEKLALLEKEKSENDAELIAEQLGGTGMEGNRISSSEQIETASTQISDKEKVSEEVKQEETTDSNNSEEIRTAGTEFLK